MNGNGEPAQQGFALNKYLSPLNVWALVLGCAVGWGAFVMPATTLLPAAGPVGTVIALALGALIIIVIGANFHFMANRYPESGGAFVYVKRVFGHDHAFLCAWALTLAYISIMWANATAFILISRFLFGPVFQVGFHYTVAGYDVYFGETLVTLGVLCLFGLIAIGNKRLMNTVNTILAVVMVVGSAGVLAAVLAMHGDGSSVAASFNPPFAPDRLPAFGVFGIVALAPWAFLGFESVSHAAGEFAFSQRKTFKVIVWGVAAGAFIYIAMSVVSVLGMRSGYTSWVTYFADLGNLDGIMALPTFHAAFNAMGSPGIWVLAITVVAAISTSLIGLYRAAGRLLYTMACDGILPERFARLSKDGIPRNAILLIMAVSVVVPFVGRAAIGWIVDVTTVSASIVYGYTSLCTFKVARAEGDRIFTATGVVGIVSSAVFLIYPLVPNFVSVSALAPESYMILAVWGIFGLVSFRVIFQRDNHGRFGRSAIVWMFLLFLIFFSSTMWVRQAISNSVDATTAEIGQYYVQQFEELDAMPADIVLQHDSEFLASESQKVDDRLMRDSMVQLLIIAVSLAMMFNIYMLMRKREREHDIQRAAAEQSSQAKTMFLSNMSHDIRTPMNAIIGYTHLAQREGTGEDEMRQYLAKIDGSSKHLLALINDVLDMSRIESGKMELDYSETDLKKTMGEVRDMFATQMHEKGIAYLVDSEGVKDACVMCDAPRLNRVLLNLISNAYKFTPDGGYVAVSLAQVGEAHDGTADYELRVKDTGIGMTAEFAAKVFEAFERERNTTVSGIQGTGLGMAITKSIVDLMGGDIRVETAPGEGTEFVINVSFEVCDAAQVDAQAADAAADEVDFEGKRLLLVEDNEINREIAMAILEEVGFEVDTAENGQIAVDKLAASQAGDYDAVLMDIQMPVMNGYDAARAIRKFEDEAVANIPIIAASANAFAEDVKASLDAGMNDHVSKPLDVAKVMDALARALRR